MSKWKIVPVMPTEEMEEAVEHIADDRDYHEDIYCCMIASAPPASQDEELVEKVIDGLLEADRSFRGYGPAEYWAYMARAVLKMLEANHE